MKMVFTKRCNSTGLWIQEDFSLILCFKICNIDRRRKQISQIIENQSQPTRILSNERPDANDVNAIDGLTLWPKPLTPGK